jgi:mRNA interferase HigB
VFPKWEPKEIKMHVISRKKLSDFWAVHSDAEQPLRSWFKEAVASIWSTPSEIKEKYSIASFLGITG